MIPGSILLGTKTAWSLFKRFWWAAPMIGLTVALLLTRSTLAGVKADLALTIASYENFQARVSAGTAKAQAEDAQHALDVQTQHTTLNQEAAHAYEQKLVDLKQRYDALRVQLASEANPGGQSIAHMSTALAGPGCTLTATQRDGLSRLLQEADENTLKLVALQQAASEQAKVK